MLDKSIVVDLDGVVVNTYGQKFCNIASDVCGKTIRPSMLTSYNFTQCTPLKLKHLIDIFAREGFYKNLRPLPLAVLGLQTLYAAGFQLHIMTVRPSNRHVRSETLQWLARHEIPFNSIHILSHAEGGAGKARTAKAMGISYFVEDNPSYANELAKVCASGFLINTRYNREDELPRHVSRVDNISDMAKILLA